jgi:cation diffusion facilitator family transporter
MHPESLQRWEPDHDYIPASQHASERRTWLVIAITVAAMLAELAAGYASGSMALVADGWHMATHAAALGISAAGYLLARRYARHPRFAFGTGKIGPLAGYTSAGALLVAAGVMAVQSTERLLNPAPVEFTLALAVAAAGLVVNLACALILSGTHRHDHHHAGGRHDDERHAPAGGGHHHPHVVDHGMRAAILHVVADALTSVLAIVALICARQWGWLWLDPVMGLVGAAIVGHWSLGLMRDAGATLLDAENHGNTIAAVRARIESSTHDRIVDLHLWRLGPTKCGLILSVVSHSPQPAAHYKALLADVPGLAHVTVEVNLCTG